jgi:hypothetical protein
MPIEVIKESRITANVKYDFNNRLACFQLRYIHEAVTSLATSRVAPIIATGIGDPGKIAIRPKIEK